MMQLKAEHFVMVGGIAAAPFLASKPLPALA